jgi:hypothetical protein
MAMATHTVSVNGQETDVTENESEVVQAIRRDYLNPVKLAGLHGVVMYGNSSQVTSIGPRPEPRLA